MISNYNSLTHIYFHFPAAKFFFLKQQLFIKHIGSYAAAIGTWVYLLLSSEQSIPPSFH